MLIRDVNLIIAAVVILFAQIEAQAAPTEGDLKQRVIKRQLSEASKKESWNITVDYPEISLAENKSSAGFNRNSKALIMDRVNAFKKQISEDKAFNKATLPEGFGYDLNIGYSVEFFNKDLISVLFEASEFTNGAHPNHWSFTLNYDLKNSRPLKLVDLFKNGSGFLAVISATSIDQITKEQGDSADSDWIKQGAGKDINNFRAWSITKKGLKFIFDPYDVAPYAAGSFTTVVPYEYFDSDLQKPILHTISLISFIDGNPPNWCRSGFFPKENVNFMSASISGDKDTRAYFYKDDGSCPNGKECLGKSYVIPGDELIVSKNYGNYLCSWYQPKKGAETVGWISRDQLSFGDQNSDPTDKKWLGTWTFADSDLHITKSDETGLLSVKGNAFWHGLGDNIHIGEVDAVGKPAENRLSLGGSDEYDCRIKMQRIGRFLLVSDNGYCGGVNVTFDGVYQRK